MFRKYKSFVIVFLIGFGIPLLSHAATGAVISISPYLPGSAASPSSSPGAYLYDFYYLALIVGGILAFGAIVFGGIKYATSGGNPSAASEARQWIQSALVGLLLLAAAYLILATISPGLTSLNFASLGTVSTGGGVGAGAVNTSATGPSLTVTGNTNGLSASTVTALNDLTNTCDTDVTVTSGVTGTHSVGGTCTHSSGCKADIAPTPALNACITGSADGFTPDGTRSDGAALYKAPDGAIYANELTRPSNCGSNCNWTGPHWDMSAGGVTPSP